MGSPYFATNGYASPLTPVIQDSHPDLPGQRATGLHQDNQRLAGLPSCVTPSLAYYRIGSHAPPPPHPQGGQDRVPMVTITAPATGPPPPAREDPPAPHRPRHAPPPPDPAPPGPNTPAHAPLR